MSDTDLLTVAEAQIEELERLRAYEEFKLMDFSGKFLNTHIKGRFAFERMG